MPSPRACPSQRSSSARAQAIRPCGCSPPATRSPNTSRRWAWPSAWPPRCAARLALRVAAGHSPVSRAGPRRGTTSRPPLGGWQRRTARQRWVSWRWCATGFSTWRARVRYAGEALALSQALGRDDLAAAATGALALADSADGDLARSLDRYHQVFVRAGRAASGRAGPAAEMSAFDSVLDGPLRRSDRARQRRSRSPEAVNDTSNMIRALSDLGMALGASGRYDEALRAFEQARRFGQEYGIETWGWHAPNVDAWRAPPRCLRLRGRRDGSRRRRATWGDRRTSPFRRQRWESTSCSPSSAAATSGDREADR